MPTNQSIQDERHCEDTKEDRLSGEPGPTKNTLKKAGHVRHLQEYRWISWKLRRSDDLVHNIHNLLKLETNFESSAKDIFIPCTYGIYWKSNIKKSIANCSSLIRCCDGQLVSCELSGRYLCLIEVINILR